MVSILMFIHNRYRLLLQFVDVRDEVKNLRVELNALKVHA